MKWFGTSWGAPCCEEHEHVLVPEGAVCSFCGEAIEASDSGVLLPHLDNKGWTDLPQHRECFLRQIFGSVSHQLRLCSCYGRSGIDLEEATGLTRRQAARLAERLLFIRCVPQPHSPGGESQP